MCRWFAYLSPTEPCLLEDVLITPAHALTKQVSSHYLPKLLSHHPSSPPLTTPQEITLRNRLFNVDGLGVAWYTPVHSSFSHASAEGSSSLRPALYRSSRPGLHDLNFRSICANTSTLTCFAHIRAATDTLVTPSNNHPFVFGRHSLMHNGYISDFLAIKRDLCALMNDDSYANVGGSTDSEHLAGMYMTYLTDQGKKGWEEQYTTQEMHAALEKTVGTIIALQKKRLGPKAQPSSLNVCVTDGVKMVAYRFRNHPKEQPPSLYWSTKAGVTLNRKYPDHPDGQEKAGGGRDVDKHGSHVIVASEPSTYREEDWELLGKNTSLMVEKDGSMRKGEVHYEDDFELNDEAEVGTYH